MQGRVRLHSGGIGMSDVRLARRGASERKTAPGRDIRDLGPDRGPRLRECRNCKAAFPGRGTYCPSCTVDRDIIRAAREQLKAAKEPGLSSSVKPGAPYGKLRRKAAAASERLAKRAGQSGASRGTQPTSKKSTSPLKPAAAPSRRICKRCRLELPATGQCDACSR